MVASKKFDWRPQPIIFGMHWNFIIVSNMDSGSSNWFLAGDKFIRREDVVNVKTFQSPFDPFGVKQWCAQYLLKEGTRTTSYHEECCFKTAKEAQDSVKRNLYGDAP